MENFQVMLSDEQSSALREYIYSITQQAVEEAKHSASIDKQFLRKGEMAKWLSCSHNTLTKMQTMGLPTIQIDGMTYFSKDEVSKFLLTHQK